MKQLFIANLCFLLLFGCADQMKPIHSYLGETQGTYFSIKWIGEQPAGTVEAVVDSVLRQVDNSFSTYLDSSIISRFNSSDRAVEMNSDFSELTLIAKEIYELTNGSFDPTIGPLVSLYGFYEKGERLDFTKKQLIEARRLVGMNHLYIEGNSLKKDTAAVKLDFNAIAQGFTADLIGRCFNEMKIESYLIEVGGELLAKGMKSDGTDWLIGIEKPSEDNDSRELMFTLSVKDKAVATSGNYRKFYDKDGVKIGHTINPKTGMSVIDNLLSATVVADDCARADAIATAFMVMGAERAMKLLNENNQYQAVLMYHDESGEIAAFISESLKPFIQKVN